MFFLVAPMNTRIRTFYLSVIRIIIVFYVVVGCINIKVYSSIQMNNKQYNILSNKVSKHVRIKNKRNDNSNCTSFILTNYNTRKC